MTIMGGKNRWRTMPWMMLGLGILIVPLGGASIFFIIIQPIVIGTWCTLCLIAALAMALMVAYPICEIVATGQFLVDAQRKRKPFWRVFWMGDTMKVGHDEATPRATSARAQALHFQSPLLSLLHWAWR